MITNNKNSADKIVFFTSIENIMNLRKNVKMKNNLIKKIIRSLVVSLLIVIDALYIAILWEAMNPIMPPLFYYIVLILITVPNIFTLVLYLLNKEIKVIRIIVSSISLLLCLTLVVIFYRDYLAWACISVLLALLMLDIFLKPLKRE